MHRMIRALGLPMLVAEAASAAERPNIVFFTLDMDILPEPFPCGPFQRGR